MRTFNHKGDAVWAGCSWGSTGANTLKWRAEMPGARKKKYKLLHRFLRSSLEPLTSQSGRFPCEGSWIKERLDYGDGSNKHTYLYEVSSMWPFIKNSSDSWPLTRINQNLNCSIAQFPGRFLDFKILLYFNPVKFLGNKQMIDRWSWYNRHHYGDSYCIDRFSALVDDSAV